MVIHESVSMEKYTTFRMGGVVAYLIEVYSTTDIEQAIDFAEQHELPYVLLGGGSNILFPDGDYVPIVVIHICIAGITVMKTDADSTTIEVGAGVIFDDLVAYTVEHNLLGLEMLSAIPGTVGATPVQNVGAYGGEVSSTISHVTVYDTQVKNVVVLSNRACQFGYRDSLFKKKINRYIILSVAFRLRTVGETSPPIPLYPGVQTFFKDKGITTPTLSDIRNAITQIRWTKLPDPKQIASCGSFFKNPIISQDHKEKLATLYPEIVCYDVGDGMCKVGAGWLIDKLGLKGHVFDTLMLYDKNALVLVNTGGATMKEVKHVVAYIQDEVQKTFGISIEPEPVFVTM